MAKAKSKNSVRKLTDPKEVAVLLTYIVQQDGQPTLKEIREHVMRLGFRVHHNTIRARMKALRSRDIISVADAAGTKTYRMAKPQYKISTEIAHFRAFPELMKTPGAQALASEMEAASSKSKGKGKRLGYQDYYKAKLTFRLPKDGEVENLPGQVIAGGNPATPEDRKRLASVWPDKGSIPSDVNLCCLYRNSEGRAYIPSSWWRAWTRDHLRLSNKSNSVINYFGFSPSMLPEFAPVLKKNVIITSGRGAGFKWSECVPPGVEFSVTMTVPARGGFKPDALLEHYLQVTSNPIRGLGAMGHQYGRVRLVDFEFLGKIDKALNIGDKLQKALASAKKASATFE